jgi:uncharacterized protein YecE (DUF72 family)
MSTGTSLASSRVSVGTSGYAYPDWRGRFYPQTLRASAMLAFYAERFATVEINASFYRMPNPSVLAGWAAATPGNFVFALKAPRRITHDRRLRDVAEPLGLFRDAASALGHKLGPLLFQLPPNFRKDAVRLADFLLLLPPGLRCAFEFRHASWFADDVYELLRGRDAALCIADTEAGTTPDVATACWGYLRLRDVAYADAELDIWAARIQRPGWREAFVYFKHEETAAGPELGARLQARVRSLPEITTDETRTRNWPPPV